MGVSPPGNGWRNPQLPQWWLFWSVMIIAAGLGVRLIELDYSFDGDELFSASLASRSWRELLASALADRTQAPLHILLLSGWSQISGGGEWELRLSSVLFSLCFLIVLRQLAKEQLEPWPGLLLLLIGSLGTFFVSNGQQLRPYPLSLLLSCLSLLYFMRLMTRGWGQGDIMAWGLVTALAVGTSYVLVIYALIQLGLLMVKYPRMALGSLIPLAVGLLPLGFWVWLAFSHVDSLTSGLGLVSWIARPYVLDMLLFYIDLPGTLPGLPQWLSLTLLGSRPPCLDEVPAQRGDPGAVPFISNGADTRVCRFHRLPVLVGIDLGNAANGGFSPGRDPIPRDGVQWTFTQVERHGGRVRGYMPVGKFAHGVTQSNQATLAGDYR